LLQVLDPPLCRHDHFLQHGGDLARRRILRNCGSTDGGRQ
jgi:hypothetical protein